MKHFISLLTAALAFLPTIIVHAQTYQPSNRIPAADNSQIGTIVNPTGANNFNIDGGLRRGQNLLHSFSDFSIPTGGAANFTNPAGNRSIITRVTGNSFSDINGLLNTNGANFLLINPQGVVFGTGVKLDMGKAFVTSTASGVDFVDAAGRNYNFGVNRAGDAPLLSIDPNVAFNPARLIMNASIPGSRGIENYGILETQNPGQYIGLIGGNVTFNGGQIIAPGGRVELGGLSAPGTVGLGVEGNMLGAQFPTNVAGGDVSFTNGARLSVAGSGGGDIAITARNIEILGASVIRGGIEEGLGTPQAVGGDIKLDATGAIVIAGSDTTIANRVRSNSQGNGGNTTINAGSFSLRDGARLTASTLGTGNAGNVTVTAKDTVSLVNANIFSTVEAGGVGKGGNISLNAGSLSLLDGSQLLAITRSASATQPAGRGDAGNVIVKVTGAVDIAGTKDGLPSAIFSFVNTGTVGKSGNITIDTGSFSLRDGAQLEASTSGKGNAGNVKVTAKDAVSLVNANIFSSVEAGGVGNGGNITIDAGSLSLQDGAQLITITRSASDTQPAGQGDAGNVIVKVSGAVDIAGINGTLPSGIRSFVGTGTVGKGGNIEIDAGSFSLRDGAGLVASTSGTGNAGNIGIKSSGDIALSGTANLVNDQLYAPQRSLIISSSYGVGDAGKISIDNPSGKLSLSFSNIQTNIGDSENKNATGIGQGIAINARELEIKNNSLIVSDLVGKGQAGNIDIKTTGDITISGNNKDPLKLTPFNISGISSNNRGIGDSGKISINTPGKLSLDSTGVILSQVAKDAQGTSKGIKINVGELNLTDFGGISSDTLGKSPGGDIEIAAKGAINIIKNSSIQAGSVKLTRMLNVPGISDILVSSTGEGKAGNISISSERLNLNSGFIYSIATSGSGGNITLNLSDKLLLRNNSEISTSSGEDLGKDFGGGTGGGNGGNITINSPLIVALPSVNFGNDITANAFTGKGGNVNITSQGLFGIQYRPKGSRFTNDITASSEFGLSGSVQITTPGTDPGKDKGELTVATNDASNQISQSCGASQRDNKFYITGRGGLPPNAREPQESDALWSDARAVKDKPATTASLSPKYAPPAIGLVLDKNGRARLIAAQSVGELTGTKVVCPNVGK
ncbi:filamentous hemagglutinin N-terminal domain-containing protein [Chamaesiphon sp. VAR_48_metabat_135_sub]|uniref:two-partner secretion domain-containing protein n=1 Tax=Chamaesiphon sp. VAR_48_metabat_135_sub TaxID=2964699 RepID=UPI00286BF417|nr:filamentous hemagglutinin N-terminal domain-containing protein [Chamaesiphon sp. VAR_48_metabat_135_sub]